MVVWVVAKIKPKINKMIQTKEELFLAELGINTKEEIELVYGAKIKITELLKKYETKQLPIHIVTNTEGELCDKCYDTGNFYLGTACPNCNRPFRSIKA